MSDKKCSVGDCKNDYDNLFFDFGEVGLGLKGFCKWHYEALILNQPKWHDDDLEAREIIANSSGNMVIIDTWKDFKEKIKPLFLRVSTSGLEMTRGKCVECGKTAVAIRTFLNPVCEKHLGFPKQVIIEAIRDDKRC